MNVYIYIYIYVCINYTYIYICIHTYIYIYIGFAITSPTIINTKHLIKTQALDFTPLVINTSFFSKQGLSEIIIGNIIVKSQSYDAPPGTR